MSTTSRQASRERSRRSSLPPPSSYYTESISQAGTKRLFSNRYSKTSGNFTDNYENADFDPADLEPPNSGKRQRNSDWPLPTRSASSNGSVRAPLRSRNAPNSPSARRSTSVRHSSPPRPSKFVEGSMNDRISQKPPIPYLGDAGDEFLSSCEYHLQDEGRGRKLVRSRKFTNHPNASPAVASSVGDRSESRHPSIFQFGRSIAARFNPSNWKVWPKQQQVEEEEDPNLRTLRERQAKAERVYKELKESGQFLDPQNGFRKYQQAAVAVAKEETMTTARHDSGVALGGGEPASRRASVEMSRGNNGPGSRRGSFDMPGDDKRKGRVFLEPPAPSTQYQRGESPAAGSIIHSTPGKQSFHFKKPSLSNMKKPSLANIKKAFASPSGFVEPEDGYHPARRIPSRKDLQKQQKLVKRVSDLEGKLETARRQLNQSLGEPLPDNLPRRIGRSRFVPGALASLPSERLLAGYVDPEDEDDEDDGEHKAITAENTRKNGPYMSGGRGDENLTGFSNIKQEGRPAPRPRKQPEDRAIPSVEGRGSVDFNANHRIVSQTPQSVQAASTISEPRAKSTDPDDTDYREQSESAKETTPPPKAALAKKKRKSNFERIADDGGIYQPSGETTESDAESEVKKTTRKSNAVAGARSSKLRKTSREPTAIASSSMKILPASQHPRGYHSGPGIILTGVSLPPQRKPSTKLHKKVVASPPPSGHPMKKGSMREGQQSSSPPPSGEFTGLESIKPMKPITTSAIPRANGATMKSRVSETAYVADPSQDDVPPVPKIPKSLRLPSGEVVETGKAAGLIRRGSDVSHNGKIIKKRPASQVSSMSPRKNRESKEPSPSPTKSFEWPEDVF